MEMNPNGGGMSDAGGGNPTAQPSAGNSRYGASGLKGPWEKYSQGTAFKKCPDCGVTMAPSQTGKCDQCERLSHSQSPGRVPYSKEEAADDAANPNDVIY